MLSLDIGRLHKDILDGRSDPRSGKQFQFQRVG